MTEKDWHVTDEKIAAIKGAPSPKNVAELCSYLGLLNYYGNFIPSLSTLLQPLHELLRKGVKWAWTEECEKAFVRSKSELVADKVLVSYDERRKLILTCDACTATEMIPTIEMISATEMIPTTEMIPIRNRNDPVINFRNFGLNGLGTLLSILNSSFIHANTILNRGK